MAILTVLTYPDPRLREKAIPVAKVDDDVRKLMDDLHETMEYLDNCGGLAATQVGDSRAVIVFDAATEEGKKELFFMANPKITWKSKETVMLPDGCMSVPNVYTTVPRHVEVEVTYLDYNNEMRTLRATGRLAHAIQHETEHLEGILYIDHLSPLKRRMLDKKYKKFNRELPV